MTIDYAALPQLFAAAVPFAGFLGITYDAVSPGSAVLRLADDPAKHNHIGTLHAGALFSLAESASGLCMMATVAERLAGVTPLAARAEITYRKVARGDVTATARVDAPVEEILATLDSAGKVRFAVEVELADSSGEVCAEVTVDWHLRRA
ncbi:MAG TPA: YiiD C-terminal domain-containing protein [Frankiaceae bacterium]|nr:YiiD C-terminal domain-containing protein [Frankiaceae bacterium]